MEFGACCGVFGEKHKERDGGSGLREEKEEEEARRGSGLC